MLDHLPIPAIIAHRGSSAHAPENSLAAFTLAVEQGADAIEMDVQLSADGHVVAFHDQTLDRLTNGNGKLQKQTLAALKSLTCQTVIDGKKCTFHIPTLEEIFSSLGDTIYYVIELKHYHLFDFDLIQKVYAMIKHFKLEERIILSSFNPFSLIQAARLYPRLPLGLLVKYPYSLRVMNCLFDRVIQHHSVHLPVQEVSKKAIQTIHRSGKSVFAFTVNDPDLVRRLVSWRIDGIFSDDPLMARSVIG